MRGSLVVWLGEAVVGYVHKGGCENEACLRSISDGRPFHARPRIGTLDDYHFRTLEEAVGAVEREATP